MTLLNPVLLAAAPPSASPTFWEGVAAFVAQFQVTFHIFAILLIAGLLRVVLHFVIRRVVARVVSGVKRRQQISDTGLLMASPLAAVRVVQRTRTLGTVLNNVVSVVIVVVALLLIITAIDKNILGSFAIITAALGAGLGFGAQNIVKDVLNGLFMVAEDQLGVGDVVDVGPAVGVVEAVGIRITQLRSVDGTLWFVRNGEILRVGNQSQGWARVLLDLSVPYTADVSGVQTTMLDAALQLWDSPAWRGKILEKPEIWGIESVSAEALVVRLVVKTRTNARDDVARELRMRLKKALDDTGFTALATPAATAAVAATGHVPPAVSAMTVAKQQSSATATTPSANGPAV
ncbi:MAG: mechanosensitive ion channel [Microbacteriaceae bacterium]|nr:mechanosensitive ion channel [Microbacteriaceae bacterium]